MVEGGIDPEQAASNEATLSEPRVIAERLHDGPIQSLTAAGLWLVVVRRQITDPEHAALLEKAQAAVSLSIGSLRELMSELGDQREPEALEASLDDGGLSGGSP